MAIMMFNQPLPILPLLEACVGLSAVLGRVNAPPSPAVAPSSVIVEEMKCADDKSAYSVIRIFYRFPIGYRPTFCCGMDRSL